MIRTRARDTIVRLLHLWLAISLVLPTLPPPSPLAARVESVDERSTLTSASVATAAEEGAVSITEDGFSPPLLVITVGDAVTWTNDSALEHQVRAGTPAQPSAAPPALYLPVVQNGVGPGLPPAGGHSLYLPALSASGSSRAAQIDQTSAPTEPSLPPMPALPAEEPAWESAPLLPGQSFSRAFTETGTVTYYDPLHPDLIGQIQVIPAALPSPTPVTPNESPTIAITSPAQDAVVANPVQVTGVVSDDGEITAVTVNGAAAMLTGNNFSAVVNLTEGNQLLTAIAVDDQGASAAASRVVAVDGSGPQISILSPAHRRSVFTDRPLVSITYADFYGEISLSSLAATLRADNGAVVDVTGDLVATAAGADGVLSNALTEGQSYTLTVSLADDRGNQSTAISTFFVPIGADSLIAPTEPADAGAVTGAVYDSATCDVHLTACDGLAGAMITLARVDATAAQQTRSLRQQANQQRWLRDRSRFDPMPPRALALSTPVSGTVISGPDGFFVFPVAESGLYWLRVEKDGYTYAQRELSLARNHQTAADAVYLTPLDPALTPCDVAGCAHTNSDGSMQVVIPAGAIAPGDTLDVTATVFDQVEFLPPGSLPPGTWETYAFNLGGDSDYTFQPGTAATVRIANSRGFAPGTSIPLGYWNPETLAWEHAGQGAVDAAGVWVEMTVTHFSNYDCNDPISTPELETEVADQTDDNEVQECPEGENGCFVDLRRGALGEAVTLPPVQILGENVAPTLLYNTDRVVPAAVIDLQFLLDFQGNVTLGETIGFELFVEGIRTQDFTIDADLQPGEVGRFRYLWDGRDAEGTLLPPGLYAYTARFRVPYEGEYCYALNGIFGNPPDCENGATGVFVTGETWVNIEGTVDLNTQLDSPLGAGWVLAGLQRLYRDDLGRILITDGDRAAEFFDPAQNGIERGSSGSGGSERIYQPESSLQTSNFSLQTSSPRTIVQGLITADTTWDLAGSPYVITSTVIVNDKVTLTIEPGVEVQANAQHGLIVLGALNAAGNTANPIAFGPVTPGVAWLGVQLGSGAVQTDSDASVLRHLLIEGAGLSVTDAFPTLADLTVRDNAGGAGLTVALVQRSGSLSLTRIASEDNGGSGFSLTGGDYVLDAVTARGNGQAGIGAAGIAVNTADSQVTLRNSTIQNNFSAAVVPAQTILTGNTFADNLSNVIAWIGGVIDRDVVWQIPGIDGYQIIDQVTVAAGSRLTIPPGTPIAIVAGVQPAGLNVLGSLYAVGTPTHPITFTQIAGAPPPDSRIDLRGAGSHLAHVVLDGLGGEPGALNVYANTPTLNWLTILNSGNHGLYVEDGGALSVHNSHFQGNDDHGVFNNTPSQSVDATDNYWGALSGPFHPTLNPSAVGDRVSDGVLFDPWLTAPPASDGAILSRSAADYSTLARQEGGPGYVRRYPDGVQIFFNADGIHTHTLTRHGVRIDYSYNGDGAVVGVAVTAPGRGGADWTWSFSYDGGKLSSIDDPAGRTTTMDIDGHHHLGRVTLPDGSERTFSYDERGLMTHQADQAGAVTAYRYDRFGRVCTVTEPARPIYDPDTGMVTVAAEQRTFAPSDTAYALLNDSPVGVPGAPAPKAPSSADLRERVTYGAGQISGVTNRWGQWTERTDAVGRTVRYERDARNNLTRQTQPDGACVDFTYDGMGNRLSRTERSASACAEENPTEGRTWHFTFEPRFNQIKTETDGRGETTTYVYDYEEGSGDAGTLIRIEFPEVRDETGAPVTPTVRYSYNAAGQILSQSDPHGVITRYIYTQGTADEAANGNNPLFLPGVTPVPGLLTQVIEDAGNQDDLNVTTVFRGFDGASNPTERVDPHGALYRFAYDAMNRLVSTTDPLGVVTRTEYDPRGNPARMIEDFTPDPVDGLNVVTTYAYNLYTQLTRQETGDADESRALAQVYDVNRNLAQVIADTASAAAGHVITHRYDDANQRTATVDPLGHVTAYAYDARGRLAAVTHPDGAVDRYVYDALGRLVQEIDDADALALTTRYEYDDADNIIRLTDPSDAVTCYTYDALNRRLSTVTGCGVLDLATHFTYDVAGRLVSQTDPRGVVTEYVYDDLGRELVRRYDAAGLRVETRSAYAPNGDLLSAVDGRGVTTTYTYDPLSRRLSETVDPNGLALTSTYAYDSLGRLIAETDPAGNATTHTVNAFGERLTTSDPLGNTTRYAYDINGNLIATTDPTGVVLTQEYDALHQLTAISNPLGHSQRYVYDASRLGQSGGNQVQEIDANDNVTVRVFDGAQRLIRQTDALSRTVTFAYDGMGRLIEETEPLGGVTAYEYDAVGRLIEETNPLGERTRHVYDGAGNRVRTISAIPAGGDEDDGQTHRFVYDGLSRPIEEIDALGNTTRREYDLNGNPTATVDPRGGRTTFAYDAAGRLTAITDPLGQVTGYVYDPRGQIVQVTHANGDVIQHVYDAAGREIRVVYPDGTIDRIYDAAGRMTGVRDAATDIALSYDALGRIAAVVDRRLQKTVGYTYDAAGNRSGLIAPDGLTVQYAYDAANQLIQAQQGNQTFTFVYDADGRMVRQEAGSAGSARVQMQIEYDDLDRPARMEYRDSANALLDSVRYTYDAAGNRSGATFADGDAVIYTYDAANRLTGERRTGALRYEQSFEYDAAGNRTRQVVDGAVTTFQYNPANQLVEENGALRTLYTYDARNRLVTVSGGATRSFAYNASGDMIDANGADGTSSYTYDAFRRRVAETTNGSTIRFLHDGVGLGTTILAEYGVTGRLAAGYALTPFVDGRLARSSGSAVHYYLPDGLGSTRLLVDEAGAPANRYEYDAFGQTVVRPQRSARSGAVDNAYQFSARRWDEVAALYDNRARRYDPRLGRFLQADPLGQVEQTNLYQYARNNPATRIDPLGWSSTDCLSVSKKSEDLLGLKKYTERLNNLMSSLPSRPTVKAGGTLSVQGKLCSQCCKSEEGGNCPGCPRRDYVGSISVVANADLGITWPLAAVGLEIRGYAFKFGVEGYGKLNVGISGVGELDYCKGQTTVKLCGGGSVTGGVKGGLLKWPFEVVKLEAYVYGQISGSCQACIGYSLTRGVSLLESKCQACAEAGYKVEVKFLYDWVSYSRQQIFARGCIG